MLVRSAAGFMATSTFGSSPGVRMSWSEKWIWKPETPGQRAAGARISAGKSGSVDRSLPTSAVSLVKRRAGQLHAVAGVAGEADDHLVERSTGLAIALRLRYNTTDPPMAVRSTGTAASEQGPRRRPGRTPRVRASAAETAGSCGGSLRRPNPCRNRCRRRSSSRPGAQDASPLRKKVEFRESSRSGSHKPPRASTSSSSPGRSHHFGPESFVDALATASECSTQGRILLDLHPTPPSMHACGNGPAITASSTNASSSASCAQPGASSGRTVDEGLSCSRRDQLDMIERFDTWSSSSRRRTSRDNIHLSKRLRARLKRATPPIDFHERLVLRRHLADARAGRTLRAPRQRSGGLWFSSQKYVAWLFQWWDGLSGLGSPPSHGPSQLALRCRRKKAQGCCGVRDIDAFAQGIAGRPQVVRHGATSVPPSASTRGRPHRW